LGRCAWAQRIGGSRMNEQAPANMYGDPDYLRIAGAAFMAMGLPRPRKFAVHDGGRRMLAEKTERPTLDLKIIQGKNQP
jgi:hypothetical protein